MIIGLQKILYKSNNDAQLSRIYSFILPGDARQWKHRSIAQHEESEAGDP